MSNYDLYESVSNRIKNASGKEDVAQILKDCEKIELSSGVLGQAFEKMFVNAENGFSPEISMAELERSHHSFRTTNGGDWCRSNNGYLGSRYYIIRKKKGNKIVSVKTDGINKKQIVNNEIRNDISKDISKMSCSILDIKNLIECDHKDGMKDEGRLNNKKEQQLSDFQPLCKTANIAKRDHCKECKRSHKRYDAKKLGYSCSYTHGSADTKSCIGCYWFDPKKFNSEISASFNKKD